MGQILEKSVKIFFGSIPVYPPNFQEYFHKYGCETASIRPALPKKPDLKDSKSVGFCLGRWNPGWYLGVYKICLCVM